MMNRCVSIIQHLRLIIFFLLIKHGLSGRHLQQHLEEYCDAIHERGYDGVVDEGDVEDEARHDEQRRI